MQRRSFLQGLLAGGVIVAGELWVPGQKLISIPSGKIFTGYDVELEPNVVSLQVTGLRAEDRVYVIARYQNGKKAVFNMDAFVKDAETYRIKMPLLGQDSLNAQVIHAKSGDMYESYQTLGTIDKPPTVLFNGDLT